VFVCETTPITRLAAVGFATTSISAIQAEPPVGMTRVVSIPTVVVLPAPLGPKSPKISPARTDSRRPSTARTPVSYVFDSPSVRITASVSGTRPL
jgi:hypothetical protein